MPVQGTPGGRRTAVPARDIPASLHWTNRVDDVLGRQAVAPGELGLAGFAAVQGSALGQQLRPCRRVNGTIYPAAAQQDEIGGVDDGVALDFRDVRTDALKGHRRSPNTS